MCQTAFDMLKGFLLEEPVLKYPKPDQPYILYTDTSKYAWAGFLTQAYKHILDGKETEIYHSVTYVSGLFRGRQINWAALVKEAYAIYMAARKLHYYISNADTTIRSDHMPLRKFLLKNTKNATVNNWAVGIEDYNLKFEYIKGVKNTLADTMSRLVCLDPNAALPPNLRVRNLGSRTRANKTLVMFSQTHKIGIIANFVFPFICHFLLYLYHMMFVNEKLDISG